jgi:hypothetical protein
MNNEFNVKKYKDATVYTLESATGGGTSAGSIASVAMPVGGVQKRASLVTSEANKNKPTQTNPVAKAAQRVAKGSGAHKNPKKVLPRKEKHRKPMAEDHEIQMASSELQSIAKNAVHLLDLVRRYSEQEGLEAWQQSKITKAADYLNSVLQAVSGEQDVGEQDNKEPAPNSGIALLMKKRAELASKKESVEQEGRHDNRDAYQRDYDFSQTGFSRPHDHRGLEQELAHETNNYAVAIDGRTWKVFADKSQAQNIARSLQAKGKNATVHVTGANPTEGIAEDDTYMESLANDLAEKLDPHSEPEVWVKDFQKANPNKYHQFKNKTPQKKAQMAIAARYAALEPSKKK